MRNRIWLAITPLLFVAMSSWFREMAGPYSRRSIDPEYIYFISSLSMANGIPDVQHVDNPGTPLQVLGAIAFRLIHLVRHNDTPFTEDVLTHSDLYLAGVSHMLAILLTLALFGTGWKAFRITSSLPLALLLQTAPLIPGIWFTICGRVTPELLFPLPALALTLLMLSLRFQPERPSNLPVLLACIHAFGLSIKLTWAPLLLLTPWLLQSRRDWLRFLLTLLPASALCAFPVLFRFPQFKNWVKNLFLHSGRYGGGEADIVHPDTLLSGLESILRLEPILVALWAGATLVLIVKLKNKTLSNSRLLTGLWVAAGAGLLMCAKHFEHRYLIPVILMQPILILLIWDEAGLRYPQWFSLSRLSVIVLLLGLRAAPDAWNYSAILRQDRMNSEIMQAFVRSLVPDRKLILATQAYGAPFPEYALAYSVAWAGPERVEYEEILGRHFPYTWQYFTWDKHIRYWGDLPGVSKTVQDNQPVYIYLEKHSTELLEEVLDAVFPELSPELHSTKVVFLNPETGESISRLR